MIRHATHLPRLLFALALLSLAPGGCDRPTGDRTAGSEAVDQSLPRTESTAATDRGKERRTTQLAALGYLSGYRAAGDRDGVTRHEPGRARAGLTLCNGGHGESAILIDMEGRIVHRWEHTFPRERRALAEPKPPRAEKPSFWRRVHLLPDGSLLALVTGYGVLKVDRDSNLLWAAPFPSHHDFCVTDDGLIHCLAWERGLYPGINPTEKIRVDFVVVLDPDGRELRRASLLDAFRNSTYRPLLERMPNTGHTLHTNTLEVFDGSQARRSPLFRRGNALVSMRSLDAIAIVDLEKVEVVWALTGQWREQHQPTLLANGRMLLFDNRGRPGGSQVLEFDPFTQQIVWAYEGSEANGFDSPVLGSCSRLDNGNTLISDSVNGRAFEVTPAGDVVWEYVTPFSTAVRDDLIATLLEAQRIDPAYCAGWLAPETPGLPPYRAAEALPE